MTTKFNNLVFRPITGPEEIQLFCQIPYVLNFELEDDLVAQRRRPEWMWVALDGDRLLARVAWWSRSDDSSPSDLDILDVDDGDAEIDSEELCFTLLETATAEVIPNGSRRPDYGRFIPADWRDQPETSKPVEVRMAAVERAGAHLLVERLRFEWRDNAPVENPRARLSFRSPADDEELIELMTMALEGTLDVHSQRDLTTMSARDAAVRHFEDELVLYKSPHGWWRVATLPGGDRVGFVIPARNSYHPIIAYIVVVPALRGNGYIDEILAEGTRILPSKEVPPFRASTDLGNVPMAKAFSRAGWINFERSIDMTWHQGTQQMRFERLVFSRSPRSMTETKLRSNTRWRRTSATP